MKSELAAAVAAEVHFANTISKERQIGARMEGILCHLSLEEGIHGDARHVLWNEEMVR